ncbi:NADH:flavin oxidoreductase/NADH oxidase [Providencia vermicola]|uniref:NADH:flavin oxidoreductase/NADH oxidase n=2 Tax=Providencia TaxID=586 RepID=A0AAI9I2S5_PROST|nr:MULTISPECIES: NADH:flavin oxidoreductase/NADH oxidase [Providencia]ELR5046326.1 NADH:flavin oxidoreductase/NADH oxidase [Providencia rettgeri]ELR5037318.1 NADH:flavin oxidoreductase/NADH oxidase [Providencia stuartii]ELR5120358.1 NADH:flavin oxidoreductase/NADH oxidase [Providencia stuartii]ELR5143276.1 NADH:flavin oxidoreductase/NADH oxidase [Providencia stuartii]ELR5292040.1 NADH:flavin oxidoreductase/NADH oxidase [Providencia stuartii]
MSFLFSPASLGQVSLNNRIIVPPMCQYSATDGMPTAWHNAHYMNLALSGAALVIIEASAVTPVGRITYKDLGLWNDEQADALKKMLEDIRQFADARLGIQLAHAGRKASSDLPWLGGQSLAKEQPHGWQTVSASNLPFGHAHPPRELSQQEITETVQHFVDAAKRAEYAGFDVIEIHAAHGYLLHQFLSPLSNTRQDEYGGSFTHRSRLLIDVFREVREAISPNIAVGVRISATDWVDGGWNVPESIELSELLEELGCDYIHVSSGGLSEQQQIPISPNYQVPLAQAINEHTFMPVIAVGLITEPAQAEAIIATGQADFVSIGRGMLFDPRWPWHAATQLAEHIKVAPQYLRSAPHQFKQLFS